MAAALKDYQQNMNIKKIKYITSDTYRLIDSYIDEYDSETLQINLRKNIKYRTQIKRKSGE